MYPDWAWQVLFFGGLVWFLALTYFSFRQGRFLKSLFPKSEDKDIRNKFSEVINITSEFKNRILDITKRVEGIEESGLRHIQKVKLVRYNPYQDTGGDQSFSVVFLDKDNNGLVITSLHTRSGTRIFAKPVVGGGEEKYQFSKEEEEAIVLAVRSR